MDGIGRRADPIRIAFAPFLGCDLVPLPRTNPFPGRIPATRFRLNALDKLIGFDTVPGRIHHCVYAAFRPKILWRAGLDALLIFWSFSLIGLWGIKLFRRDTSWFFALITIVLCQSAL